MKITILGCGTAHLNKNKHEASYLIEHNNKKYLFDSGAGTVYQILKKDLKVTDIDYLFYTHLHNDHISDLPAILWSNNWDLNPRNLPLIIHGPNGLKDYMYVLTEKILRKDINDFKYVIEVKEITNKEFELNGLKIKTLELNHYNNIAYRLEFDNKIFVYTGDTGYCKELIEICEGADLCIMECGQTLSPNNTHMTPENCGKTAKKSKIKRLVLTHSYPDLDTVDVVKEVKKKFDGEIILAEDFMEFEL